MSPVTVVAFVYCLFLGLIAGSFINLVADRRPRGESIVHPRSHCRACGRLLNAIDLLPVLGYVLRGGRCASCRAPIGISAPVIEAVSGAVAVAPVIWLGAWPGAPLGLVLVAGWGVAVTARAGRRFANEEAG